MIEPTLEKCRWSDKQISDIEEIIEQKMQMAYAGSPPVGKIGILLLDRNGVGEFYFKKKNEFRNQ